MDEKAARGSSEESTRRGVKRGSYAKTAQRRQQIIDQTLLVYDERGVDGTSLRAIAEAIGVTHPVLVHQFGTREELFLAVLREYDDRLFAIMGDWEDLNETIELGADQSLAEPGLMALLNSMVARALETGNERSRAHFSDRYARVRESFVRSLRNGQANGTVRLDIPLEETASLILAASDGLTTQWLLDGSADFKAGLQLLARLLAPST